MKSFKRSETTINPQAQRKGCLSYSRHTKLTVFLILPSFTVRFPIAFPSALDAGLVVSTLELICTALYHTCKTPVSTVTSSHGTVMCTQSQTSHLHAIRNNNHCLDDHKKKKQKQVLWGGGGGGGGGERWRRHQKKQKN